MNAKGMFYYFFNCDEDTLIDELYMATEFKTDLDAIRMARRKGTMLFRIWTQGQGFFREQKTKLLYRPAPLPPVDVI